MSRFDMGRLPVLDGDDVVRAFQRAGWRMTRRKGSHVIMQRDGYEATLSVPVHAGRAVKRGTLRALIKDAGMTVEDFTDML